MPIAIWVNRFVLAVIFILFMHLRETRWNLFKCNLFPPFYQVESLGMAAFSEPLIAEIATNCADDFITKISVKAALNSLEDGCAADFY